MNEPESSAQPDPEQASKTPSIEQIVKDLDEFESGGLNPYNPNHDFTGEGNWFESRFGYPNPFDTASDQYTEALKRGEERPLTTEMMAVDIYNYEKGVRQAVGNPIPSFEETYGYPDPRQVLTEATSPEPPTTQ